MLQQQLVNGMHANHSLCAAQGLCHACAWYAAAHLCGGLGSIVVAQPAHLVSATAAAAVTYLLPQCYVMRGVADTLQQWYDGPAGALRQST